MAEQDYLEHENKEGERSSERAAKAGYHCRTWVGGDTYMVGVGENLHFGPQGYYTKPKDPVRSWMNSPGPRKNMLNPTYNRVGAGIHAGYLSGYGYGYFTTMVFC